jgi:ComF family protein
MEGLTCLWAYEGVARKIVTISKYKYYFDVLRELTSLTVARLHSESEFHFFRRFLATEPEIVPVPLWPKREKQRGFNQAEVIAKIVGRQWALGTRNLLLRVRDTGRQVGRTKQERLKAVEGAFTINSKYEILSSKEVPKKALLVDDVWTTGATMNECAKVLKQAGVRCVWGLVLAR